MSYDTIHLVVVFIFFFAINLATLWTIYCHFCKIILNLHLNFIKAEWGYVNSPKNITLLVKNYFNHKPASLIEIDDFINIVLGKEKK